MPHVAARRIPSADGLQRFLNRLAIEAQVDRLFVIAGDSAEPAGPFVDALSVITGAQLGDHGIRSIGIAGYPEGHPQISTDKLNRALADKSAALTDFGFSGEIVTQFAFDADPMLTWVAGLRAAGIRMPVRLGLPGPANVGTLLRFAARCGVGASTKVLAKYGASITKLLHTAGPDHLYNDLARSIEMEQHGAVAVHLYPFGGLQKMADWAHTTKSRTS
nr:methylenetetrahydrofolate reductase [Nitrospirillum iridis]